MEEHYINDVGKITYVYGVNLEEHKTVIEKQQKRIAELEQDLKFTTKTANELIEIKHKLEQELAELKEKAIVPRFKIGQEVYYYHIARNKIYLGLVEDIQYFATRSGIFYRIPNLQRDYFWIREDELFVTEQEAQAKLKELKGNG